MVRAALMTAGRKSETYIHGGAGNSGMWVLEGSVVFRQAFAVESSDKKKIISKHIFHILNPIRG